jgi:hypothetical protein
LSTDVVRFIDEKKTALFCLYLKTESGDFLDDRLIIRLALIEFDVSFFIVQRNLQTNYQMYVALLHEIGYLYGFHTVYFAHISFDVLHT